MRANVVRLYRTQRDPLRAFAQVRAPRSTHPDQGRCTGIASGRRGRRFKSGHPDQKYQVDGLATRPVAGSLII